MKSLQLALAVGFLALTPKAFTFPELAAHGYPNCIACHISPSGGGTMSEYGRSLSKDLLSTWSYENEELFGHGLFAKSPEWLQIGGDFRFVQSYTNDDIKTLTKNFWMQNQIEVGARFGRIYLDSSLAIQRGPSSASHLLELISPRHFIGYFFTDEFSLRFGKFLPAYGLNIPNHLATTRAPLGFNEGMEHLNLEASYLGEKFDVFLTGLLGKGDLEGAAIEFLPDPSLDEHGAALSTSAWLYERFKLGVSLLYGNADAYHRILAGFFGVMKISTNLYLLTEWDWQSKVDRLSNIEARGFVAYNELGFEAYKGINLYFVQEEAYLDLNALSTRVDSFGLGFKFYPRPHLEIQAEYRKERDMRKFSNYYDTGFLIGHYYF